MTTDNTGYKISLGIPEAELADWLKQAAKKFGTFNDGRVDYTNAEIAPIILCVVICQDELLLLKRGYGLADAEGYWSVVTGFIDKAQPIKDQVVQEVSEELSLDVSSQDVRIGTSYTLNNPQEKRHYIIFPCRISLSGQPKIVLNHEHTDHAWVKRNEVESYKILDDLPYGIDAALKA